VSLGIRTVFAGSGRLEGKAWCAHTYPCPQHVTPTAPAADRNLVCGIHMPQVPAQLKSWGRAVLAAPRITFCSRFPERSPQPFLEAVALVDPFGQQFIAGGQRVAGIRV